MNPNPKENVQDEERLVEHARTGEWQAWSELHRRYYAPLWSTVNDILHDPALTEDVLQDTFIKAVHKIGEFRGESKFSSWLYRIAVNRALDVLRQRKRMKLWMPFSQDEKEETINQIPDQHSTAQRPEEHELGQTIRQAMQKLSPEHRAVVQLRLVEGFSTEETAHILRCSKGTVLSRLFYASKKLRKLLQRYETS